MRSSSNSGRRPGEPGRTQTHDPERDRGDRTNRLFIVGIGPGSLPHLSVRAQQVLGEVESVVGYTIYIDLIRPLIGDQKVVSTPMKKEVQRVEAAIDLALGGTSCAVVSSGDAGVYAMAGLVFEMCRSKQIPLAGAADPGSGDKKAPGLKIEVVPGIPALCSGAALLGAPLTHDFAAVSLSDLLTPWEVIAQRLEAAASADFVIVLYNPKSKKRHWQLQKAQEIILGHRAGQTPVGIATRAMREGQRILLTTLADLHQAPVDMQTTVFIGNSSSFVYEQRLITPRGYAGKYDLEGN